VTSEEVNAAAAGFVDVDVDVEDHGLDCCIDDGFERLELRSEYKPQIQA
jgi:hypothetical protein